MIDTHCHLNLRKFFPHPEETIRRAVDAGVTEMIVIGIDVETSRLAVELAEKHPEVYATVGVHPTSCGGFTEKWLRQLEPLLASKRVVGYGEIGLDYYWDTVSREEQGVVLIAQWEFAVAHDLPIVIHCREAYPAMLAFMETAKPHKSLFHCFAGNAADAVRAKQLDCYYGVDGPLTYRKADDLRQIVRALPRDRVFMETDSPFLTPSPHRGKPNEPAYVEFINAKLAELWNVSEKECDRITTENARRFFRFPE